MNNKTAFDESIRDVPKLIRSVRVLTLIFASLFLLISLLVVMVSNNKPKNSDQSAMTSLDHIKDDFLIKDFADDDEGKMAAYGHRLITETFALIGPETHLSVTGNRLSCSSCHLNGGTKPYAAPYIGLSGVFPIYIGRENKIISLEERINGCLERSMNGKTIDVNSFEMRAMVTYIKHLSQDVSVGRRIEGQGFIDFKTPDRAANLKNGISVFQKHCLSCHGQDGAGLKGTKGNRQGGYIYPPLWGADSYNDGAGMARVITAAKFIKANMPLGVSHDTPLLTDEEAYDVAAYINNQKRPAKSKKESDYPDLSRKPKDCPYPPYGDEIPQIQHKFGPFNFLKKTRTHENDNSLYCHDSHRQCDFKSTGRSTVQQQNVHRSTSH